MSRFKNNVISSEAQNILGDINKRGLNSMTINWDEYVEGFNIADEKLKSFLLTKEKAYQTKDLATFTQYLKDNNKSLDLATLKMNAFAIAKNLAFNIGIGLLMAGLSKGIQRFDENFIKAIDHARESSDAFYNRVSEGNKNVSQNKETLSSLSLRYQELSEGVNQFGKNLSLSSAEYDEYKNIISQVSNIMPDLTVQYNEQGEKIGFVTGKLQDLNKEYDQYRQRTALSNVVNGENGKGTFQDVLEDYNYTTYSKYWDYAYNTKVGATKKIIKNLKEYFSLGFADTFEDSFTNVTKRDTLKSLQSAITPKEASEMMKNVTGNLYVNNDDYGFIDANEWKKLVGASRKEIEQMTSEEFENWRNSLNGYIEKYQGEIDSANNKLRTALGTLAESKDSYWKDISESDRSNVSAFLSNMTDDMLESLKDENGYISQGTANNFVANLIKAFKDNNIKDAFNNLMSLDFKSLPYEEAKNKMQSYINTIAESIHIKPELLMKMFDFEDVPMDDMISKIRQKVNNAASITNNGGKITFKSKIDDLSFEDLQIAYDIIEKLGKDGSISFEDLKTAIENAKNEAKALKDTTEINLSSLSEVGDSLSNLSNAAKEVGDNGYVSFGTLSKIKEEFADVDGIDNYITKLAKARSNSSDFQETLAELTIGLVNSKYSTEELANADEALIANMLRSYDVANADAVAHQLVATAKVNNAIATYDGTEASEANITAMINECFAGEQAREMFARLQLTKELLNKTKIETSDDIDQLIALANAAGASAEMLKDFGTVKKYLASKGTDDWAALTLLINSGATAEAKRVKSILNGSYKPSFDKLDPNDFKAGIKYAPKSSSKSSKSGSSKKDNTAKKQRDFNDKIQGYYDDLDEAQKKYDEKLAESYKNEKEKIDDYSQQLTEAQEKFNEDWKEAWDKEHLETLKADLEERMDLIDRYKKAMETVDFGLDLLDENDFTNKSDLLSQKLQDSTNYGAALRTEFERLLTIVPQGAEEAQEIADRLSDIGQKMRDNVSTITETQIAIQKLRVDALSSIATTHIDELERELSNIDKRIEILSSDNKNDYKYTSEILNITSVLPLSSDFDKQLREKRRQTRSLVQEEQDRQDQINKIITDALALQHKENAEAREKERQDLLKDFEKTREDLNKKIAEVKEDAEKERQELYDELEKTKTEIKKKLDSAVLDYQEDTGKIVSSTQSMIDSIQDILNTEIKMPEIDLTDFNKSVDTAVEKVKSAQTTVDNAAKDMAGAGAGGSDKKSGSSKTTTGSKSSGGSIPAGATVYMYSGNKAGHVGIYDGKGNIISNEGGKITTKSFDKMFASGYYRYRGWGWNGGVALSSSDAAKVVATTSKVKGKGGKCQAWVADVYAKALGNGRVSAATANKAGDQWIVGHATGTPYHPGGLALLGDEGQGKYEAAILPDGSVHIIGRNGAELVDLPMGTSVIPHDETKELLSKTGNIDGKKIPKYAEGTTGISSISDTKTAVEISEAYKLLLNKIGATEASEAVDRFITQPRFTKLINAIFSKLSNNGVELGYIHPGESLIDTDTLEEYYAIAVKENDVLLKAVLEAGKNAHDYTSALAETDNILMAYSKVGFLNNPDLAETIASTPLGSSGITIADLFKTDEASRTERYAQTLANGGTSDGNNSSTATSDKTDSDSSSKNSLTVEEIENHFKDIFAPFDKTLKDSSAKESQIWGNSDMSEKDKVYAYFNLAKGNLDALMEPGLEALKQMVAEYTAYMKLTEEHPELFDQKIVDAYVDGISDLKDRLTSVEDKVASTREKVISYVTNLNSEIEDYISERNLYNDWRQYGDSLTAAIRRELANLNELYKQGVYSLKEFNKEKAKLEQEYFSYGKQEFENAVNKEISKIEKKNEKEKELLNFRSSQYEKQKTLLQEHFNITNSIADARHEINKQLNTSKAMYEYLDEDTRKLLFNQKDYNKLSSVLNDMEYEARKLQSKYIKDIQNAEAENIDEITSKYQMQYQGLSNKYEIAKADLEVAKKQQQLNNVLAERNTRMFIDGKWQWVANSENVENAMNELEDAKYAQSTANTSLSQTVSLNQLQSAQDGIATQVNLLDKFLNDARERWEKIQEKIEGDGASLSEVLHNIATSDCPALQNIVDSVGDIVKEWAEDFTGKTLTLPENYISTHDYMQEILDSDNSEKVLALNKKRNAKIESEGLEWKPFSNDEILKIWNDKKADEAYEAAKQEISQFISNLPRNLNGGGEIRLQGDEAFNKLIKDLNTLRAYESAKTDLTTELAKKTWIEIPEGLRGAGNIIFTPDQMSSLQNPMDLAKLDMFKANSVQISVPQSIDSSVDNSITINGLKLSSNEIGQEAFNSLRRYVSTHKR